MLKYRMLLVVVVGSLLTGCFVNSSISGLEGIVTSPDVVSPPSVTPGTPSVDIAPVLSNVNSGNLNNYALHGQCSNVDAILVKTGSTLLGQTSCVNDSFSISIDLSSAGDGTLNIALSSASTGQIFQTRTLTKDTAVPSVASVNVELEEDNWSNSQSPLITWNSGTDTGGTGIDHYEIAIGTAAGLSNVKNWTNVGNVTSTTLAGLTLNRGTSYHVSLRAVDTAGNTSAIASPTHPWLVNNELWLPNGNISSSLKKNGKIYIAGSFTQVGPWTGGGVVVDSTTNQLVWPASGTKPRVAGLVHAVISDGSNGWFIAGLFNSVGGVTRSNIAHLLANGTLDSSFNIEVNGRINALAKIGTRLFIGGEFTGVAGATRNRLASISLVDYSLDTSFVPNLDGTVLSLESSATELYVGGSFANANGSVRTRLAAYTFPAGTLSASFTGSSNQNVRALKLDSGVLYAGGEFTNIGGIAQSFLAALNPTTGSGIASFAPSVNSYVYTLIVMNSKVYFGGWFTVVGGQNRGYIAAVNTADGSLVSAFNAGANGRIGSIIQIGGDLIAGGRYESIGGTARRNVARLSAADGSAVAGFSPKTNEQVYALALNGSNVYVGGVFSSVNGVDQSNLAAISLATGEIDATFQPNANGPVNKIAEYGNDLFVGGSFSTLKGQARTGIGLIGTDGTLRTTFNPVLGGPFAEMFTTPSVYDILVDGSQVYVGGNFISANSVTNSHLTKLNISDGSLAAGFNAHIVSWADYDDGHVKRIHKDGTSLIFSGVFDTIGGQTRSALGKVSATTGAVDLTFAPNVASTIGLYPRISGLVVVASKVYIAGRFTSVSGTNQTCASVVDKTNGSIVSGFTLVIPALCTLPGVSLMGSSIIIDGLFKAVDPVSASFITPLAGTSQSGNNSTQQYGSTLFVSGNHNNLSIFETGGVSGSFFPIDATTGKWLPGH